jgi:hypothetical protein
MEGGRGDMEAGGSLRKRSGDCSAFNECPASTVFYRRRLHVKRQIDHQALLNHFQSLNYSTHRS